MKSSTFRYTIRSRRSACFHAALLLLNAAGLPAATHTVTIAGFTFQPSSLTISVGDTVRWVNQDAVGHTTTCDRAGDPVCGFSPLLGQSGTFQFTYTQAGTFPYHCSPHPFMLGTVTVRTNNPPAVAITSPSAGAVFTPPMDLEITVTSTDTDGTVARVEFFANGNAIGLSTAPPFRYTAPAAALPPGDYALTVRATDDAGAFTVTPPVPVRVRPPLSVAVESRPISGALQLRVTGALGLAYALEATDNLYVWTPLLTNTAPSDVFEMQTPASTQQRRFFRVRQLPQETASNLASPDAAGDPITPGNPADPLPPGNPADPLPPGNPTDPLPEGNPASP